jgi:flavin reductase (DIM6/NTAB) family NADH-FMN oxidoreductase RutF
MKQEKQIVFFPDISYPSAAVLVTCRDDQRRANIITIAWHTPLSKNPPLYGIAVAPKRFSHNFIKSSKEFVVNFLTTDYVSHIHCCGTKSGKVISKIDTCKLTYEEAISVQTPRIKEAYAHIECQLYDTIQTGDHSFFIGKVSSVSSEENAFDIQNSLETQMKPTYYLGNNIYTSISKERYCF